MIFVNHVSVFVRFFFPLLQNHDFPLQDYHPRKYQQWYSKKPFQSWLGQCSTVSTRHWSQIHLTNFPWDISKVDLFSLASHHQRNWGDNMLDGTIYVEETPYVKRPTPRLTIHTFHSIFHHFLGLVARLQLIWPHQFHSSFLVSTWESSFSSSIKHQMLFLIEKERMNFKVWQEKWKKNEKKGTLK